MLILFPFSLKLAQTLVFLFFQDETPGDILFFWGSLFKESDSQSEKCFSLEDCHPCQASYTILSQSKRENIHIALKGNEDH